MNSREVSLERLLTAVEEAPPVDSVAVVARILAERVEAREVCFLITDFAGDQVRRLPALPESEEGKQSRIDLPGTIYDEVIRSQRPQTTEAPTAGGYQGGFRTVAPVTNRGDAIGLLELTTPATPTETEMRHIAQAAHALAYVLLANGRFTDLYEWGQRPKPPTLAAEIQQNLLPDSLCCEAGQATVAGALEPAEDTSGDTFDYALDEHTLQLAITDAMGHNTDAALLSTIVTGALRNARRARRPVTEMAQAAHEALREHGRGATVTGQLLRIELATGRAALVNAGHPWPFRLRDGQVTEIRLHVDLPFGGPWPGEYHAQDLDLQPGDRLMLFTDGMTERNTADLDLPALLQRGAHLHLREAARFATRALREATGGEILDDATVLCLDWHGPGASQRNSHAGADTRHDLGAGNDGA